MRPERLTGTQKFSRSGFQSDARPFDLVTDVLEKQLDRAIAPSDAVDGKAALVIPAVAGIAGIFGTNIRPDVASKPALLVFGLGFGASAVASILLSLMVIKQRDRCLGPVPLSAVQGISEPPTEGQVAATGVRARPTGFKRADAGNIRIPIERVNVTLMLEGA